MIQTATCRAVPFRSRHHSRSLFPVNRVSTATAPVEPSSEAASDFGDLWQWQRLRRRDQRTHREHAAQWARSVLDAAHDWLFVDTETTGLSRSDQVIELAVAAPVYRLSRWQLEPVMVQRMRPSVPIDPGASMVHGIYARHLVDAPTFHEVAERIRTVMHGRRLLAWNAPFDRAALRRTVDSWKTCSVAEDRDWYCAMR